MRQRVFTGVVTQMQEHNGIVDQEVHFPVSVVVGRVPLVGEKVLVKAVQDPLKPISWTDRSLWRDSGRTVVEGCGEETPGTKNEKDGGPPPRKKRPERAAPHPHTALRCSPVSPGTRNQACVYLELQRRYPNLHLPSDLFHLQLSWTKSFPLEHPLPLTGMCRFHMGSNQTESEADVCESTDDAVSVRFVMVDSGGELRLPGGHWSPKADGQDSSTLVNTAVRCVKEQTALDLSACSQWHKIAELRYISRSKIETVVVLSPADEDWTKLAQKQLDGDLSLPEGPSVVLHPSAGLNLSVVSLSSLLEPQTPQTRDSCEVSLMAEVFSEMLQRDFGLELDQCLYRLHQDPSVKEDHSALMAQDLVRKAAVDGLCFYRNLWSCWSDADQTDYSASSEGNKAMLPGQACKERSSTCHTSNTDLLNYRGNLINLPNLLQMLESTKAAQLELEKCVTTLQSRLEAAETRQASNEQEQEHQKELKRKLQRAETLNKTYEKSLKENSSQRISVIEKMQRECLNRMP